MIAHRWEEHCRRDGSLETPADHAHNNNNTNTTNINTKPVRMSLGGGVAVGLRGSHSRGMHYETILCRLMGIGASWDGREGTPASPHTFRTKFPWPEHPTSSPDALSINHSRTHQDWGIVSTTTLPALLGNHTGRWHCPQRSCHPHFGGGGVNPFDLAWNPLEWNDQPQPIPSGFVVTICCGNQPAHMKSVLFASCAGNVSTCGCIEHGI